MGKRMRGFTHMPLTQQTQEIRETMVVEAANQVGKNLVESQEVANLVEEEKKRRRKPHLTTMTIRQLTKLSQITMETQAGR